MSYLKAARDLIAEPKNWCQGTLALDKQGEKCDPKDPEACKFCATGALKRVCPNEATFNDERAKLAKASRYLTGYGVINMNDGTNHSMVLSVFDLAIGEQP
jgi:hypothetical protein